jgi:hypothetical protein
MAKKFHFSSNVKFDLALLSETESVNPYSASKQKSGPLWDDVAQNLINSNLEMPVNGRRCRERVTQLLKEHIQHEALSLKA